MIRSYLWNREITRDREWRTIWHFLLVALLIALLLGGVLIALLLGGKFGHPGLYVVGGIIGLFFMTIIIILRQDELAVVFIIAVHLYVDWYLGQYYIALITTLALLIIFYAARSPRHRWAKPPALWLWGLFLVLTIAPAIQGAAYQGAAAASLDEAGFYYPNLIFGALIFFWLGTVIALDDVAVRRLFKLLAGFGTLIAVHTIIQETTGTFLFATSSHDALLASVSDYQIGVDGAHRAGSFFVDPNWNGAFFATMLFISLGLFAESSSFLGKALYLAEAFLMLPALLFTYSNGSWVSAAASFIIFVLFVGRARYRVLLPLFVGVAAIVLVVFFPSQVALQLQHAAAPNELSLRVGVWQTAIRVIRAFPLAGVGLSHYIYQDVANPYRVPAQYVPEDHPHDSYLEWGAMAGLPVLLVFVALLLFALWLAIRNWALADIRTRSLLGGGIAAVMALSINSVSINGWTLPPLAALGWLILGAIASPLLRKSRYHEVIKKKIS